MEIIKVLFILVVVVREVSSSSKYAGSPEYGWARGFRPSLSENLSNSITKLSKVEACGQFFHIHNIWFSYGHFGIESVPDP